MKTLIAVAALAAGISCNASAADAPKVTSDVLTATNTTVTGQKIEVPQNPNVVVSIATFPPGAALPVHKHPYPHYVYVLQGDLTVTNDETKKVTVVKQGQFLVEMNNTWHFGKNNGTTPVKLLVIDQLPAGASSNVVPKPAQ